MLHYCVLKNVAMMIAILLSGVERQCRKVIHRCETVPTDPNMTPHMSVVVHVMRREIFCLIIYELKKKKPC
jgi:hypothetical protein